MHLSDRLIGFLTIIAGLAIIAGTLSLRSVPGQDFGAAFFPRILGGATILTGAVIALKATSSDDWVRLGEILRGRSGVQVLAVLLSVILWVSLSQATGFIASTTVLIAALILLAGGRVLPAILTAICMTLLLHVIFGVLLRVPLPFGFIEKVIS